MSRFHPPFDPPPPKRPRLSDRLLTIALGVAACWAFLMCVGLMAELAWYLNIPEKELCLK